MTPRTMFSDNETPEINPRCHVATLPDSDILNLSRAGKLITENFDEKSIKQACYELRASSTYYTPPDTLPKESTEFILIKPKQIVVSITMETVDLPADILGRILTKGQLFSIGLSPVNTYADPGFTGRLGIVLCNFSNNYLKIKPGDPIAKIEFSRLAVPVSSPYKGQHGYQTRMWPIPQEKILTATEVSACRKDGRISDSVTEVEQAYGPILGDVLRRVFVYERRLLIFSAVYTLATVGLIALAQNESMRWTFANVFVGAVGSFVVVLLTHFATNLRRK